MRRRKIVAIIWLIFLIRGAFYCRLIPLWEGFDEWSHYAFLEHLRLHPFVLPCTTDPVTEEIRRSVQSQPIRHEAADPMLLYEAKQPPLYYWILSIPNRIFHALPIAGRVFWLRILSILLASLAIPFGYLIALKLFGSPRLALTVCALIVSMPGLMIDIARVGNDSLSVAIASWIILLLLGKKSPWLGLALGVGLLTKAFFLAFVPLLIFGRRLYSLAAAVAISGWWYWRTIRLTGTLTGETIDAAASRFGWSAKFRALFHDNWLRTLDSMVWTHIWTGAWSFFTVRSWMYRIFEVVFAATAIAIIFALLRRPGGRFKRKLALICSMEILFALGIFLSGAFDFHCEKRILRARMVFLSAGRRGSGFTYSRHAHFGRPQTRLYRDGVPGRFICRARPLFVDFRSGAALLAAVAHAFSVLARPSGCASASGRAPQSK